MKDSFSLFKLRLLLQALDRVPNAEQHAMVIEQANAASAQAGTTSFPELVLPCLFEELLSTALNWHAQRERVYWSGLQMPELRSSALTSSGQTERPNVRRILTNP